MEAEYQRTQLTDKTFTLEHGRVKIIVNALMERACFFHINHSKKIGGP